MHADFKEALEQHKGSVAAERARRTEESKQMETEAFKHAVKSAATRAAALHEDDPAKFGARIPLALRGTG